MTVNKTPNRLIKEKSPYLLQHAYNPVDWYPWGNEAFEKAKRENKPVFVSIGYSTCHWCHVMERETFENEDVAKILNAHFVSIKVDREERPDIDSIYMLVCQMMNGHGGWPLSVFLTPDQVPFYTGTYFPRESRYGMPGFIEVLTYLHKQFTENRNRINEVTIQVQDALRASTNKEGQSTLTLETIHRAFHYYEQTFDTKYGGFGEAPKFPMPHTLSFLLMYSKFFNKQEAGHMVTKTLDGLARGGIYDHIGYGFSRYSVDEKFLVPHFEKMLYDNALLIIAYTEAFQMTKDRKYQKIVDEIITYILRDMEQTEGGFYSAEDADSEGKEGKFYVWTPKEIKGVLGNELGELYCKAYDITEEGNFEGENIPNLISFDLERFATKEGRTVQDLRKALEIARETLFFHREKRVRPFRDDKVLTAWNGLMIASLAKAGRVFQKEEYMAAAKNAIKFIENNLVEKNRLMVRYREGEVKHKGIVDDYAFLLWAYIELYDSTFEVPYLEQAKKLSKQLIDLFWDEEGGGFFLIGKDQEQLIIRQKESYDGALPSGNSVCALQLLKLAKRTGDYTLEEKVQQLFSVFSKDISEYPSGHSMLLQSLLLTMKSMKEVVVVFNQETDESTQFIRQIIADFNPEITLIIVKEKEREKLGKVASFINDYHLINGKPTVYVCENYQCNPPTNDFQVAKTLIKNSK